MVFQQLSVLFTLSMLQQSSETIMPDITLQGTKITNGSSYVYQFTCATNVRFWGCTIELLVKDGTNVDLRLSGKTCYNRYNICKPEICSCSDGCNEFKWNLTTQINVDNTSIECEGRLQKYDLYFKANAHIIVNRNGFINLGSTVDPINGDFTSVIISSTSSPYLAKESCGLNNYVTDDDVASNHILEDLLNSETDNQTILIVILCFVSLIPIVLFLLILRWIHQHFYESEGGSNDKLKIFCCPLSRNQSPAMNRSAKKRGTVKTTEINSKPNERRKTTQSQNSNVKKPEINIIPIDFYDRKHKTQQQSRAFNTTEISMKPNERKKTIQPQSSYIKETEVNINPKDVEQTIQQQSNIEQVKVNLQRSVSDVSNTRVFRAIGPFNMNPESRKNNIKLTAPARLENIGNPVKDTCSMSSESTDGNASWEHLIKTSC